MIRIRTWTGRRAALTGVLLVALNLRIAVAVVSPITSYIGQDIEFTPLFEQVLGIAPPLCFAVFGLIAPVLGRRFGLEATLVGGMALSAISEAMRASVSTPWAFLLWTIPIMAGSGIGNIICPPVIKKYFPDRLGLVTGIYTASVTLSTALPPLFVAQVAAATGWRPALGMWCFLGIAAMIPWLRVLFHPARAGHRLAAVKRRLDPTAALPKAPKLRVPLWRAPVAWMLMLVFGLNSMIGYAMFAYLPGLLRDAGYSIEAASMWLAVLGSGTLPVALVVPGIMTKLKHRIWVLPILFMVCYLLGFGGLMLWPRGPILLWIALTRIGDGFFPYCITLINLRTKTSDGSVAMSGFVQSIGYILGATGPLLFGALHAATGNWTIPMIALLCILPFQATAGVIAAKSKPLAV